MSMLSLNTFLLARLWQIWNSIISKQINSNLVLKLVSTLDFLTLANRPSILDQARQPSCSFTLIVAQFSWHCCCLPSGLLDKNYNFFLLLNLRDGDLNRPLQATDLDWWELVPGSQWEDKAQPSPRAQRMSLPPMLLKLDMATHHFLDVHLIF